MNLLDPRTLRAVFGNIWFFVCLIAAGSCFALAAQLLFRIPPLDSPTLTNRVVFGIPALFGGLAALYGMLTTAVSGSRQATAERLRARLRNAHKRLRELEDLRLTQRGRIEELSTLREVATVINQESDFGIIAEKVLELLDGLLEPVETTIFLIEDGGDDLEPFGHYADGKFLGGNKVPDKSIPDFELSEFQSHSVVCRIHHDELYAIVPLKVEEKILGVLLLVFLTDSRPPEEQREQFNRSMRRILLEVTHHISLAVKTKYLHTKAVVDSLTRLYSRSHFNTQLRASAEFARRSGEPFSLVLLDIDHFKKVNDKHGHASGDLVLSRVAGRIQRTLRKYDTAYRYGGEEIAALLPRTRQRQAVGIAERLRQTIEEQKFRGADNQLIPVTVSLGVAQFNPDDDVDDLFEKADKRLYRAKEQGRNRVVPPAA
jgi:diguanylate cyclase (GGDEF)-like protein